MKSLADRIEARIRQIPARNPVYISMRQETIAETLDSRLIRKIAEAAAKEARTPVRTSAYSEDQ